MLHYRKYQETRHWWNMLEMDSPKNLTAVEHPKLYLYGSVYDILVGESD